MKKDFVKVSLILALVVGLAACGGEVPSKERVKESIKKIMPLNFEVVNVTPFKEIPGLVQVVLTVDKQPIVFYMDKKAKYVVSGSIVEPESKRNLTLDVQNTYKGTAQTASPSAPAPSAAPAAPPQPQAPAKK